MTQSEKGSRFQALHEGEPFVIPNPWDAGSARVLASLGFPALATTSGGFAFTLGKHDGHVTSDEIAEHTRVLSEAVDVPISVDLENGYGPEPETAASAIERIAEAGAVGGSIEDYDPRDDPIFQLGPAPQRIAAAPQGERKRTRPDFNHPLNAQSCHLFEK